MKLTSIIFSLILLNALPLLGDESKKKVAPANPPGFKLVAKNNQIKVMSFNLHNLFDAEHDRFLDSTKSLKHRNDSSFLPKSIRIVIDGKEYNHEQLCILLNDPDWVESCKGKDWTQKKYEIKLRQLKKAVFQAGPLPDILGVQEIESDQKDAVAEAFRKELGYDAFIVSSTPDVRGITNAIFYQKEKLRYVASEEISVAGPLFQDRPTRNILRVTFELLIADEPTLLSVFVNHWPSKNNINPKRMHAARTLKASIEKLMKSKLRLGTNKVRKNAHHVIALGDFNILLSDMPNPIHNVIVDPNWKYALTDLQHFSYNDDRGKLGDATYVKNPMRNKMAPTSYWYMSKNSFQEFDHLFLSKNLHDGKGLDVIGESFRILSTDLLTEPFPKEKSTGTTVNPIDKRYPYFAGTTYPRVAKRTNVYTEVEEEAGFSDHFAVYALFEWKQK